MSYNYRMAPKVTPVVNAQIIGRHTGKAPAIRRMKLRYPELSEAQIAKRVGCDPANVHRVLKRFLGDDISQDDHQVFQDRKAEIYDRIQHRMLGSITDDDIAKAPLLPRVTAAAILEDKARVIRGQATQINVTHLLDAVAMAKEIQAQRAAEAMEAVRRRMALERQAVDGK